MDDDFFHTAARAAEAETKVLGSRFVARVWPVAAEADALRLLAERRRADYDATHHVLAYRLGTAAAGTLRSRADDDSEPSGTAGAPVLRHLEARGLTDTLVVVTRWFGGTKLGTGGLARAYGHAAAAALDAAGTDRHTRRVAVRVAFAYADTSPALHTIGRFDAVPAATDYGDRTAMTLLVRASQAGAFARAFRDALGGRGEVERA